MPKAPERFAPLAERLAFGRSLRGSVRRVDFGAWVPSPRRPDPVAIVRATEGGRVPELVPIRRERMAASPFGFFRGSAAVMAWDLGQAKATGALVQICGDAHVRNLGAYAAEDGHLVFDVNDFDETLEGPWEWDLLRLAASFVLAAREAGESEKAARAAVKTLVRSWRESLFRFLPLPVLELARREVRRFVDRGLLHPVMRKAERETPAATLRKLTAPALGGGRRFRRQAPLLAPLPPSVERAVLGALPSYRLTLGHARRLILDAYRPVATAFKVVGTGSVGLRDYVVLLEGNGPEDPLFLQVKEAVPSCWAPYLRGRKPRESEGLHEGERVAAGQHRMQTVSDPFLGWTTVQGRPFLVRQLADHKASLDPADLRGRPLLEYALLAGETFAKAHARTGDPAVLAGYAGRSPKLDEGIARFSVAYADRATADHEAFVRSFRTGRRRPAR